MNTQPLATPSAPAELKQRFRGQLLIAVGFNPAALTLLDLYAPPLAVAAMMALAIARKLP